MDKYVQLLQAFSFDLLHIAQSYATDNKSPKIEPAHLLRALLHKSAGLVNFIEDTLDDGIWFRTTTYGLLVYLLCHCYMATVSDKLPCAAKRCTPTYLSSSQYSKRNYDVDMFRHRRLIAGKAATKIVNAFTVITTKKECCFMPSEKTDNQSAKPRRRPGRPPKNPEATATTKNEPPKKAYVFFNCDAEKSQASKNIFYNNEIFRDVNGARKALWDKVKEEMEQGRVVLLDEQFSKVRHEILNGSPVEAAKYLQFASIDEMIIH